jgi:hypothetical protein
MRRAAAVLAALALLTAACSDDARVAATTVTPTTTAAGTATTGGTMPASSTTAVTTTTTPPATTTRPGLPGALPGSLVPWEEVGGGWAVALYTASWGHPFVLYLLSPQGAIYEVFTWTDLTERPLDLYDWKPDGKAVLVAVGTDAASNPETRLLDLQAGTSRTMASGYVGIEGMASFTRPTGRDVVVRTGDGTTEFVEVRHTDGSLFSTLLTRPRPDDWFREATWLYGLDGTAVVLGDGAGLALVSNTGEPIRDLGAPAGDPCRPLRWWDASTILARCIPADVLAYLPGAYYGRLWLVPADGSAATPLTALPDEPVFVGDYGFSGAWAWDGGVYANWFGDCGAGAIYRVRPDGSTELFDPDPAANSVDQIVGVVGEDLLVRRWLACDGSPGSLHLVAPGGGGRDLIVPSITDTWGVMDALVLPTLP